jgi:hypothetical protein
MQRATRCLVVHTAAGRCGGSVELRQFGRVWPMQRGVND